MEGKEKVRKNKIRQVIVEKNETKNKKKTLGEEIAQIIMKYRSYSFIKKNRLPLGKLSTRNQYQQPCDDMR